MKQLTIEEHYSKMQELFGNLPDPVHQPNKFKFMVRMYHYVISKDTTKP